MKRIFSLAVVIGVLCLGVNMLLAQQPVITTETTYRAPQHFVAGVTISNLTVSGMTLNGVTVVGTNIVNSNIPIASMTNALLSAGPNIGGNIPLVSLTNALAFSGPYTTQNVAGVFTNVYDAKGFTVSHNP